MLTALVPLPVTQSIAPQPYMREAWRVEHRHSTHQGRPFDDLLTSMALGQGASTLDLSDEERSFSSSGSSSSNGSRFAAPFGSGALDSFDDDDLLLPSGMREVDFISDASSSSSSSTPAHILPIYPSRVAGFAPICKHVPTLENGRAAGWDAMQRVLVPVLDPRVRAR